MSLGLPRLDFDTVYTPGPPNEVSDALSRYAYTSTSRRDGVVGKQPMTR